MDCDCEGWPWLLFFDGWLLITVCMGNGKSETWRLGEFLAGPLLKKNGWTVGFFF